MNAFVWDDLPYWQSGEWQVIEEHLKDLDEKGSLYCPRRELLFAALDATPYDKTKVMFIGQDPYPGYDDATGLAFSIPKHTKKFPVTLQTIFKEYQNDLHYPEPATGDLTKWSKEGVLLWNAIPSCPVSTSLGHYGWFEWHPLTQQIIEKLSEKAIVFVFLGSVAREFSKYALNGKIIQTSHPSPRGNLNSKSPFIGSRIFTSINDYLVELNLGPINWKLP